MSDSNCCFLTCIQISQEAGQVVWDSHLFQNFPQFIVSHTVEGFGIGNKAEIDVFLELSCFFDDPADIGNLISCSSAFSKTSLNMCMVPLPLPLTYYPIQPSQEFLFSGNTQQGTQWGPRLPKRVENGIIEWGVIMIRGDNTECFSKITLTIIIIIAHIHYTPLLY